MSQYTNIMRTLVATLALSLVAGCQQQATQQAAQPAWQPPQISPVTSPELAGAWYQVYFDSNSAAVNARGQMIVKNVAYVVANNDTTRVTVIGKTDRVGVPSANMALAQRRADAVREALVAAGVPPARIDTSWTGETSQQVATRDEANEPRNRVVDVTVVKAEP